VELIFREQFSTRDEAFRAEREIKGWSRAKKLALAEGNWREIQRLSQRRRTNS
jgi:predicted GIY-YIG superfamily endonuclease